MPRGKVKQRKMGAEHGGEEEASDLKQRVRGDLIEQTTELREHRELPMSGRNIAG